MKNPKGGSLESLLADGFVPRARSPLGLARGATELPRAVADALADGYERGKLEELGERLRREHWPALVDRHAGAAGHGWPEFMAAAAVVVELVLGMLPAEVGRFLAGNTGIERRFLVLRRPFRRYAMVVEGRARPSRMFVEVDASWNTTEDALVCPKDLEHHPGIRWSLEIPPDAGRSHTLLLALLALERSGALALPAKVPLAATGELGTDGRAILPVDALLEKRRAWFEHEPHGLFLSPPPRSTSDISALLRSPYARGLHEWLEAPKEDDPAWNGWIVARSLDEAAAKLAMWAGRREGSEVPIRSWDGRPLSASEITPPTVEWERTEKSPPRTLSSGDTIVSALYYIVYERPGPRGIVIYGEPGIGKSILSHVLRGRFAAGLLGMFGFAVRRSTRELAEDVEAMPGAPLHDLLGRRAPEQRALFHRLIAQERLFLILDGLDEVAVRLLPGIVDPIRRANAWFVATSRPVKNGHDALPPHVNLTIAPLRREEALDLLRAMRREDLREQIEKRLPGYTVREQAPNPIASLCHTPFHLRLLAASVPEGARLEELDLATLYRKAFEGLLQQAVQDGRLSPDQADFLRRQGAAIVGELALAWLKSPGGTLTGEEVAARLSIQGLNGREAFDVQRALEFGYLLAPGADNIEFSHRTLAEWAAASALSRRVIGKVAQLESQPGRVTQEQLASIEASELASFFPDKGAVHESRFWQLLKFYASRSLAPLDLIEKTARPAEGSPWSFEGDTRRAFEAALELAAIARWTDAEQARIAWGLFARTELFLWKGPRGYRRDDGAHEASRERFVEAVGGFLPDKMGALIDILARKPAQKEDLLADPTMLLPFCPETLHALFEPLLRGGAPNQQAAILERFSAWRVAPPGDLARALAAQIPERLRELSSTEVYPYTDNPEERARHELVRALERLEAALYTASARSGCELPRAVVSRRIDQWPYHLDKALLTWFCESPPRREIAPYERAGDDEPAGPHRREAFSLLATRLAESETNFFEECRRIAELPERFSMARAIYDWLDRDDTNTPWLLFSRAAARAGWQVSQDRTSGERGGSRSIEAVLKAFSHYSSCQNKLTKIVRALAEAGRLDGLLGQLWPVWSPRSAERRALLAILLAERKIPPCISVRELISSMPPDIDEMSYALRPGRGTKIEPKHEAEWRELARSDQGRARFNALSWCAERDGVEIVDLLIDVLPGADVELRQLIGEELQRRATHAAPKRVIPRSTLSLIDLPLVSRARLEAPGWREEVIAALNGLSLDATEWPHDLLEVIKDKHVYEALPFLKSRFEKQKEWQVGDALGALLEPRDRATVKLLLDANMIRALPESALERLTLDELAILLERDTSPFDERLSDYVARLGPRAHAMLRAAFVKHNASLRQALGKEKRFFTDDRGPYETRHWVGSLGPLVLDTVGVESTPMRDIVALIVEVVGGDRHDVSSTPGPLGSDYDEPHDLEYTSQLVGSGLIGKAKTLFLRRLHLHPEELADLERLLDHPSETLHLHVFEELAKRTPPHEVARLAMRAIEAHIRSTDTRMQGETAGLLLARTVRGGSGSIDIRLPQVGRDLANAVRRRLTHADRDVLLELSRHEQPAVRALACRWIKELGAPEWASALAPAIEDASPSVAMASIQALDALDHKLLVSALRGASRARWTREHYRAFMIWYIGFPRSRLDALLRRPGEKRKSLPGKVLQALATGAIDAACTNKPGEWPDGSVPSLLERFVRRVDKRKPPPEEGSFSNSWLLERARSASVDMQPILYRILARRGVAAIADELLAMASAKKPELDILAAEIIPTLGGETPSEPWIQKWTAILGRKNLRFRIHELWPRLLYMLERAPVAYAPLVLHLSDVIQYDLEGSLTEQSEEILARLRRILKRWDEGGAEALLKMLSSLEGHERRESFAAELLRDVYGHAPEIMKRRQNALGSGPELEWKRPPTSEEKREVLLLAIREDILPACWVDHV